MIVGAPMPEVFGSPCRTVLSCFLLLFTATLPLGAVECDGEAGIVGDVTADGTADIRDAQQIARFSANLPVPDTGQIRAFGDVNEDGSANVLDAQQVARHAAGLASDAPVDEPCERADTYLVRKTRGEILAESAETGEEIARGTDAVPVVQAAIDAAASHPGETAVHVLEGEYTVRSGIVTVRSEVALVGAGIGETVFRMADGRNEDADPLVMTPSGVQDAAIRHLEIHGNERNNRDIPPFPDSPNGHGLEIGGTGVVVEDVYVHDTVRSNIVLRGRGCSVRSIRVGNSATDHWLYFTDAENCTVEDVRASGFARGGGIVFGVGERTVHGNTLSDVVVEGTTTTPRAEGDTTDLRPRDYFPKHVVIFRAAPNAADNTVTHLVVRDPGHRSGHVVFLGHPGASLRNYEYAGPAGYYPQVVRIGSAAGGVPGAAVRHVHLTVTDPVRENGARFREAGVSKPAVIASRSSDVVIEDVEIEGAVGASLRGVLFTGAHRRVEENTLTGARIEAVGPAVVADGREHPIRGLELLSVTDIQCSGVSILGDVDLAEEDVACP